MIRILVLLLVLAAPVLPAQSFAVGAPVQAPGQTPGQSFADGAPVQTPVQDSLRPGRLWLVGGTMFAVNAGIMGYYFATFYNDDYADRAPFHTFNDWYNADLNVDKLGHIWGSQTYARTLFHMFRWTGMKREPAMYWSSGLAMFYQLEMEVIDGMYEKWGFSWWDMGANTVGALWPNLQRVWPALQSVNIKMSYHPSDAVKAGWIEHDYLRDYDGFTYWLCLSVEDVLPHAARPYWPDWLGIAVGYGANRTMLGDGIYNSSGGVGEGEQEWYIALDYDMRALPGDGAFMDFVRESLNLFHFPAPALRITPSGIFYGLYF
ncbi:MAG: DUF2279 domain-containing protein [Bacteroidota bacterium]|nr:DUF2279 domain-containing protein [Bacteroidota bacterium]